jgi:hypothetical protein
MPTEPRLTLSSIQKDALERILALLQVENSTGTVTRRARNVVLQGLAPADLAAIAPELAKLKL